MEKNIEQSVANAQIGTAKSKDVLNKKVAYKENFQNFTGKNIPVKEAARLMDKDQQFIRQGLIKGFLPIGCAFKKTLEDGKESTQYDYYISPKLFYEYTGVIYNKEDS